MMPRDAAPARATAREQAFGLVEILVAMVIMVILAALALHNFTGTKGAVRTKEAFAAATAYESAIASWMADHGNRKPPATELQGTAGPRNLMGRPYLSQLPSGVEQGRVSVNLTGCTSTPAATSNSTAHVTYCEGQPSSPDYAIRLLYRPSPATPWAQAKQCWRGNTDQTPRCG